MTGAMEGKSCFNGWRRHLVGLGFVCLISGTGWAQDAPAKAPDTVATPQQSDAKAAGDVVGDEVPPEVKLSKTSNAADRINQAWAILTDAVGSKRAPTRIQALAALGMLRGPRVERMITDAMGDPDVDVRTAAALAAGETKDRNLTTPLRDLLDDKEPQVAFTAAMTLWKMGDRSGEDILMSVVDGDRSTSAGVMRATGHKINKDLHDPAMLAKAGAMQGAYMLLGPFGYGLSAYNFIHQSGGDLSRAAAIEQIAQERIEPVHRELIAALGDKDLAVRAAAAKGLAEYRDNATSMALYALFADSKYPVRLTAAAAYLRTTGTPGPPTTVSGASARGATAGHS